MRRWVQVWCVPIMGKAVKVRTVELPFVAMAWVNPTPQARPPPSVTSDATSVHSLHVLLTSAMCMCRWQLHAHCTAPPRPMPPQHHYVVWQLHISIVYLGIDADLTVLRTLLALGASMVKGWRACVLFAMLENAFHFAGERPQPGVFSRDGGGGVASPLQTTGCFTPELWRRQRPQRHPWRERHSFQELLRAARGPSSVLLRGVGRQAGIHHCDRPRSEEEAGHCPTLDGAIR